MRSRLRAFALAVPLTLFPQLSPVPYVDATSGTICTEGAGGTEHVRHQAEAGDPVSQYLLGVLWAGREFYTLDRVSIPSERLVHAMEWLRRAADQGYVPAEYSYGALFRAGRWQSTGHLLYWWTKAAEDGDVRAQLWLGESYEQGRNGIQQNYGLALHWLTKAAERGQADAQNAVGGMYEDGEGVPQSYVRAAFWYRKAAEHVPDLGGAGQGRQNLANLYMHGLGIKQDIVSAYVWYALAGRPTAESIKSADNPAAEHMTRSEIAEAQRRAKRWLDSHPSKPICDMSARH